LRRVDFSNNLKRTIYLDWDVIFSICRSLESSVFVERILGKQSGAFFIFWVVGMGLNCQESAILYQKLSFGPLRALFSLHEPIVGLVSLRPQCRDAHFDM